LFALAGTIAACAASPVAPRTLGEQLSATWSEVIGIPGSQVVVSLVVSDTAITGTGDYTIEAGPRGTIVATGSLKGDAVTLQLVRTDGYTMHFSGALSSEDRLDGYAWFSATGQVLASDPAPVSFQRVGQMKL
jgi:hypothetical protein